MFATAMWLLFTLWLSLEHGSEEVSLPIGVNLLAAAVLCVWADCRKMT